MRRETPEPPGVAPDAPGPAPDTQGLTRDTPGVAREPPGLAPDTPRVPPGDRPGPCEETATRRNVTWGGGGGQLGVDQSPHAPCAGHQRLPVREVALYVCTTFPPLHKRTRPPPPLAVRQVGPFGRVAAIDFAADMLERGRRRTTNPLNGPINLLSAPIDWIQADALKLPFGDNTFNAATMGYGLRNVVSIPDAFTEIKRVLQPGVPVGGAGRKARCGGKR